MIVFRWFMGVIAGLLAVGSVASFIFFMAGDDERWIEIARKLRQLTVVAVLFWFNLEVWGSVVYTLWNW